MNPAPTILIVDDDKFLMGMYSLKFKKSGFTVESALSPDEALQKLHDGLHPDILLLDVIMPGMSGLDLLEKAQKENLIGNATVVILTNQGDQTDIDKAKSLHVQGYIVKATTIPSEVVDEVTKIHNEHKTKI
jgi:CheY-like chemotaxis protein